VPLLQTGDHQGSGLLSVAGVRVPTFVGHFAHGTPKALLDTPILKGEDHPGDQYAVTADGQRFLVNTLAEERTAPISLVLNWTALEK